MHDILNNIYIICIMLFINHFEPSCMAAPASQT